MNDDHSINFETHIDELVRLIKTHGLASKRIDEYMRMFHHSPYFGELQDVLEIQEMLESGLIDT